METELGDLLLTHQCIEANLFQSADPNRATAIYDRIIRKTLGQLILSLGTASHPTTDLEQVLSDALAARNRLMHSFFLQHNFRRKSAHGRDVMLRDLDSLHCNLLDAYKAVLLLSGVDLEQLVALDENAPLTTGYLPIRT